MRRRGDVDFPANATDTLVRSGHGKGCGVPPVLREIVALPELGLAVRAASAHLDRPVRWVAVSELEDPAPFLEGGELLLTTCPRRPPRPRRTCGASSPPTWSASVSGWD